MRIQHNILAMNAYRNYNTNTSALAKNLEKLSSGYKINRAGDDAAGLAISEKMRAQITGLNAAQKNVKDGISLVKTAEGAMQEIQDMLNRMDYLATQSANGTYDNEVDRANLQKEVNALKSEINRIADSANFNGIKLLDGKNAMATNIGALGELLKDAMIDGTNPTAGGKALINVTLEDIAGSGKSIGIDNGAAKTFDGVDPTAATGATYTFELAAGTKFGGTGGTTAVGANLNALKGAVYDGTTTLSDAFDITVTKADGTAGPTDWSDATYTLAAGDKITLTAKTGGNSNGDVKTKLDTAIDTPAAAATYVEGKDEGAAPPAKEASYEIKLDLTKLEGGQVLSIGGQTFTFTNDPTAVDDNNIYIGSTLDLTDDTDRQTIGTALKTGMANVLTNHDVDITVAADGKATLTINAQTGQGEAGNLGEVRMVSNSGTNPLESYTYDKYEPAGAAAAGKHAQVTYKGEELKNLTAGTTLKIGDIEIEVVADGTNAADMKSNQITQTDAATAGKLAQVIENQKGFHFGKVAYDGTNGELTITAKDGGDGQLDALKDATAVSVSAPASTADSTATAGTGGKNIVIGTTKVSDLLNHEITVDNKSVKLGDLFNIKVTGKDGTAITGDNVISSGASISFEAKQTGKLSQAVMDAVKYSGKAATEVREGWDEGTTGAGNNTHYELNISTDNNKLAGGASFSFGTGSSTKTFDITYDDVDTDNGTVNNPNKGTEVTGERIKIKLSNSMTDKEKADAIKKAVGDQLTAFNVKTTVSGGKIKLEATAKDATDTTNYGGVRFSSAGGAFSDGVYKAYNAFDGGTEGTYAQVSYKFDPSKLKAGDKLTIGGISINVGEKDLTERDDDGNITSITISEENAQNSAKLISAFESAGFQKGQLKFENSKMIVTDGQKTGRTAEELAKELGVSLSSSTRALTSGGLTLQIGDTSDSYNQLTVSIGDMHTTALGIDGIDIGNQTGASDAIQVIRDAINQVSSVRGDLGATQNRLEHTANNLSVMAENIQDAESTIRDTDVAEEMMAYTKNNILVQSAQAMLAQANAVPQGVLQLLG